MLRRACTHHLDDAVAHLDDGSTLVRARRRDHDGAELQDAVLFRVRLGPYGSDGKRADGTCEEADEPALEIGPVESLTPLPGGLVAALIRHETGSTIAVLDPGSCTGDPLG